MAQRLGESKIHKVLFKVKNIFHKPEIEKKELNQEMQNQLNQKLLDAAKEGKTWKLSRLLRAGANIEASGYSDRTPLIWAAEYGHNGVCKLLIENHADLNAKTRDGNTALMFAAEKGYVSTCALLIDAGADLNEKNKFGFSAFIQAKNNNKEKTAKLLKLYLIRKMLGKEESGRFLPVFMECVE
jgi:ankyrin repeat protein